MTRVGRSTGSRTMSVSKFSNLQLTRTFFALAYLLLLLLPQLVTADRTKAKIYINMKHAKGCFRRMNSDGVVGCQSSYNGDVGVIHYVREKNAADLKFVLESGSTPPYIAVLTPVDFTRVNADKLVASHEKGRVNGVVVVGSDDAVAAAKVDGFSADAACPNRKFGLYAEDADCHEWNKPGSGLLVKNFPFPVFLFANESELGSVKECYSKFNDPSIGKNKPEVTYPLCGMELHSFMFGAVSSKRCLRRSTKLDISGGTYESQCDPLGDRNVFGFLRDPQSPPPSDSSVVMVTARLDATGFFEDVYPGADSPASGIVALLATAHTLKKVEDKIQAASKNVLFTLFHGESYDYLGSNRVVYDMTSSNSSSWPVASADGSAFAPVGMDHLSHFIELSQFSAANAGDKGVAYLFSDGSMSGPKTAKMLQSLVDVGATIADLEVAQTDGPQLPPASLQQFLKAVRNDTKFTNELPGVVIAEHDKDKFANKFYNSFLDTSANIKDKEKLVANLGRVATLTARSVLQLTTGQDDDKLEAESAIVDQLVQCFIYDTNCTLFKSVLSSQANFDSVDKKTLFFSYYVGVLRSSNMYRHLSSLILAKFTGDIDASVSKANCTGDTLTWMLNDGNASCVRAYVGTTEASSPAIGHMEQNILYSFDDEKAKTSAVWTESVWSPNTLTARIFLIPSTSRQVTILLIGIFEFIFFMILMAFVNKRSDILFNVDTATQQVLTEAAG